MTCETHGRENCPSCVPRPGKLCYRCGGRFQVADGSFARHDEACLRVAIAAAARRQRAPFEMVRDIEVPF